MAEHQQQQQHQGYQQYDYQQNEQHPNHLFKSFFPQNGPSAKHVVAVLTLVPIGATLLFLSGLTLVGTIIGLAVSAPLFVFFSPILVPAALVILLSVAGILTAGAFGITALSSFSWLTHFLNRNRLPEKIGHKVQDTAGYLGQKVQETGGYLGQKVQETGGYLGQKMQETGGLMGHLIQETRESEKTTEMGQNIQNKAQEAGRDQESGRTQESGRGKDVAMFQLVPIGATLLNMSAKHVVAMLTLVPLGATLLFLAGLTLVGTIIGLAVSAPLFVIFSPILVPAALVILLSVAGILTSGAFGITAMSSFSWLAHFLNRSRLPEKMGHKVQDTAGYLGQRVQETGGYLGQKVQETGGYLGQKMQETGGQVSHLIQETGESEKTREMGQNIQNKAQEAGRDQESGRGKEGGRAVKT